MFIPYSICIKRIRTHKNWSRSSLTCCERVIEIPNNRFSSKRNILDTEESNEGRMGDALALRGEEGRDKLR